MILVHNAALRRPRDDHKKGEKRAAKEGLNQQNFLSFLYHQR